MLVSFGTYTCINWIRSLAYVRAWADKYAKQGLAVLGVQTPEFDFEADLDNVGTRHQGKGRPLSPGGGQRLRRLEGIRQPLLARAVLRRRRGRIRHHQFGEGEYEESEMVVQMLLREAGLDVEPGLVRLQPDGVEAAADWAALGSPETYLGYERTIGFASPGGVVPDGRHVYSTPAELGRNQWALSGGVANRPGPGAGRRVRRLDLVSVPRP